MGKSVYCKTYRVRYNKTHAMGTIKSINVWLVAKVLNKDIDTVWKQFLADFAVLKGAGKLDHVVSLGQLSTDYDRQVLHVAGPLHIKNLCSFANSEERQILEATLFARFSFFASEIFVPNRQRSGTVARPTNMPPSSVLGKRPRREHRRRRGTVRCLVQADARV